MVYKMLNLPCATVLSVYMQCNTDPCHSLMGVSLPSFCRQRPGEVLPGIIQLASEWWMRGALNRGLIDFKAVLNHCPYLLNDYICMMLHLKCPLHTSLFYILGPNWKWLELILLYI